jgi:transketolase
MTNLDNKSVSVIRALILDGTRKANSGHPGGALSSTDMAYVVYKHFLKYDPENPLWFNRDRFVLSAGHESMLLYSLLVLQGFLPTDELKKFRQFGSLTPGHPEFGLTNGVDATTGPLGQGFSMSVGIAVAEEMLRAKLGADVLNHYTFTIAGDGDLQEPVALGAASLAGHWGLSKLIAFYDKNNAQISGPTSRADDTNIKKVFEGFGWNTVEIDGHNHDEIVDAVNTAKSQNAKPTLIIGHTIMAKGTATREGDFTTHGSPLSPEEIAATKEKLGLPKDEFFYLPEDVVDNFRSNFDELKEKVNKWNNVVNAKIQSDNEFKKLWTEINSDYISDDLSVPDFSEEAKMATRAAFGKTLAKFAEQMESLVGGSADLEPSNSTKDFAKLVGEFSKANRSGRNLSFGVREFPMAAIVNGIALHGGLKPFGATFLVFADYERAAIRLSAMQHLHVMHVLTHDSFYVGEDGPTHQPVEHLASLRAIPNLLVFRPADAKETAGAMKAALDISNRPSVLALTRQGLPLIELPENEVIAKVKKGAYVVFENSETPEIILIATGSEVHLAIAAAKLLNNRNVRVVSMPSVELFEAQPEEYKNSILPDSVRYRVAVEAGVSFGWEKFTGLDGWVFGFDRFGESAPYQELEKAFGFTPENLAEKVETKFNEFKKKQN